MRTLILLTLAAALAAPAQAEVLADVNGEKITRDDVFAMLWNLQGPEAVSILIDRPLIRQEAKRLTRRRAPKRSTT